MKKYRIPLLTLAAVVGVAGFYIIHKKESESPKKTKHASSSSFTNQKETLSNQTSEEFITTSSGLQYRILNEGSGDESPGPESVVSVHYRGNLPMDWNSTVHTRETSLHLLRLTG